MSDLAEMSPQLRWYYRNKNRLAEQRQQLRRSILTEYGGRCSCCGEERLEFLTLDHPDNNGGQQRDEVRRRGNSYYRWLVDNPQPDLRVHCWNCNMARGLYGECPHSLG